MIQEDYVSFEVAKLLKEKGFEEPIGLAYWDDGTEIGLSNPVEQIKHQAHHIVFKPTLQMAMKWLREKHKLFIDITAAMEDYIEDGVVKYKDPYYTWEVFSLEIGETLCFGEAQNVKKSYEAACDFAIKYCLENLV